MDFLPVVGMQPWHQNCDTPAKYCRAFYHVPAFLPMPKWCWYRRVYCQGFHHPDRANQEDNSIFLSTMQDNVSPSTHPIMKTRADISQDRCLHQAYSLRAGICQFVVWILLGYPIHFCLRKHKIKQKLRLAILKYMHQM